LAYGSVVLLSAVVGLVGTGVSIYSYFIKK
jgi:hypothetical protein